MENKSADEIRLKTMWCDVMWYDNVRRAHAYNYNSNTCRLNSRQLKTRQDKTRWNIRKFVAYNDSENDHDNDNDNHYSMNSDGIKIMS